ncbi:MAG TPA: DUF5060 domain-containing protein [Sunxiuqinia sp.]|nr:DUF5060 domain-containing protein [Sunxiuqinia sp.]
MKLKLIFAILFAYFAFPSLAQREIPRWDIFELTIHADAPGNPFIGIGFSATFTNGKETFTPEGFYDGEGDFKVRFMPDSTGTWTYETKSNYKPLDGRNGEFICVDPEQNNHGPIRIRNSYHFKYADGTPYYPFGTTIYEWAFQLDARKKETIETLKNSPFNKARMLAVPPFSERYQSGPDSLHHFPYVGTPPKNWDFSRFDPQFFRNLEKCVADLRDNNVVADLILFRPYDKGRWGFDMMTPECNERFVRYMIARFAAYRNIWWSLCNENSFIRHMTDQDWDHLFQVVQKYDPYHHMRSIHNAGRIYDYNKPWVTHVSLQYYNAVRVPGLTALLRDLYRKPIVMDEINYEGNISRRWGQLTGEEMTFRFWNAYIGGAYATHGEATEGGWISGGGKLTGTSPARIAFLKEIVENGPQEGMNPIDQYYEMNMAGKAGEYYLIYFGKERINKWPFKLPDNELKEGMKFKAEIIDTWNMTITLVNEIFEVKKLDHYTFVDRDGRSIKLPGKQYLALRLTRTE